LKRLDVCDLPSENQPATLLVLLVNVQRDHLILRAQVFVLKLSRSELREPGRRRRSLFHQESTAGNETAPSGALRTSGSCRASWASGTGRPHAARAALEGEVFRTTVPGRITNS